MNATHPIKAYRENQTPPLSQKALAKKLRVARNTVSRWECGRTPDRKIVDKVAELTGIPKLKLLKLEDAG